MNFLRVFFHICLFLLLISCAMQSQGIVELENMLDAKVGKKHPYPLDNNLYWHIINMTSTHVEIEQKRADGCAYALLINKETGVVESWKFTSPRSLCEHTLYKTGA